MITKHVLYLQVLELSCSVPGGPFLKILINVNGVFMKTELGACHKLGFYIFMRNSMLLIFQTMNPSDFNIKGLYQMPLGNPLLFMIDCELIVTQNILTLYFIHFSTKDLLLKYAFKIPVMNHNFFSLFFNIVTSLPL